MDSDISAAGDYGGFEIQLSDREKYYLMAAGIPEHLLTNMDRAAVVRALMFDNELVEDKKVGGVTSLIYKMGDLRDIVSHTKDESLEEANADMVGIDESELNDEEIQMKRAGYSKKAILDHLKQRKEDERMRKEVEAYNSLGAEGYASANPVPSGILAYIFGEELMEKFFGSPERQQAEQQQVASPASPLAALGLAVSGLGAGLIKLDDDGMNTPSADRIHPDTTPVARQSAPQHSIERKPESVSASLSSLSIAVADVKDNDPAHLSAQLVNKRVAHEVLPMGQVPGKKGEK